MLQTASFLVVCLFPRRTEAFRNTAVKIQNQKIHFNKQRRVETFDYSLAMVIEI